jgi:hypothetical protein
MPIIRHSLGPNRLLHRVVIVVELGLHVDGFHKIQFGGVTMEIPDEISLSNRRVNPGEMAYWLDEPRVVV